MIEHELFAVIQEAAIRASRELGDQLLEMSCFVSNWAEQKAEPLEEPVFA